jgi:UDP-N-acetylmuramate: L-alanyl-gamma-D-glutamyl-meso-diaminopimelate ligase
MASAKKAHFIGLCGIGMSATALLVKESGIEVSGSDAQCYGPPKGILKRNGLSPSTHYASKNIPEDADFIVVSRNAKLSPEENEEVRAALDSGKPVYSFPQVLGALTEGRHNLVVAGSYGKSTTTSLIAHILRHATHDVGYFVGAEPVPSEALPCPARLGSESTFVLEGDEYPSGHNDSRAKFLHLHADDIVLTAVVHDHVNVYPTYEEYQKPFVELLQNLPEDGILVVCADEPGALMLAQESTKKYIPYGVYSGAYHAKDIRVGPRTRFTLVHEGKSDIELETELLGTHNIENIIGASAYVLSRKLVSPEELQDAVASFAGVRRKLDNVAPDASVPVYEGFGSSFEKARSAIEAILLHFPNRRLVTVFEPHTFGWRNRANLSWYDTVFKGSELVFIAPPEQQGAATHEQLTYEEISIRVKAAGIHAVPYNKNSSEDLLAELLDNDVVLILTSGDLEGSIENLVSSIRNHFPL